MEIMLGVVPALCTYEYLARIRNRDRTRAGHYNAVCQYGYRQRQRIGIDGSEWAKLRGLNGGGRYIPGAGEAGRAGAAGEVGVAAGPLA